MAKIRAKDREPHPCLECGDMTKQASYCKACCRKMSSTRFVTSSQERKFAMDKALAGLGRANVRY